jgi:hypothetical protein
MDPIINSAVTSVLTTYRAQGPEELLPQVTIDERDNYNLYKEKEKQVNSTRKSVANKDKQLKEYALFLALDTLTRHNGHVHEVNKIMVSELLKLAMAMGYTKYSDLKVDFLIGSYIEFEYDRHVWGVRWEAVTRQLNKQYLRAHGSKPPFSDGVTQASYDEDLETNRQRQRDLYHSIGLVFDDTVTVLPPKMKAHNKSRRDYIELTATNFYNILNTLKKCQFTGVLDETNYILESETTTASKGKKSSSSSAASRGASSSFTALVEKHKVNFDDFSAECFKELSEEDQAAVVEKYCDYVSVHVDKMRKKTTSTRNKKTSTATATSTSTSTSAAMGTSSTAREPSKRIANNAASAAQELDVNAGTGHHATEHVQKFRSINLDPNRDDSNNDINDNTTFAWPLNFETRMLATTQCLDNTSTECVRFPQSERDFLAAVERTMELCEVVVNNVHGREICGVIARRNIEMSEEWCYYGALTGFNNVTANQTQDVSAFANGTVNKTRKFFSADGHLALTEHHEIPPCPCFFTELRHQSQSNVSVNEATFVAHATEPIAQGEEMLIDGYDVNADADPGVARKSRLGYALAHALFNALFIADSGANMTDYEEVTAHWNRCEHNDETFEQMCVDFNKDFKCANDSDMFQACVQFAVLGVGAFFENLYENGSCVKYTDMPFPLRHLLFKSWRMKYCVDTTFGAAANMMNAPDAYEEYHKAMSDARTFHVPVTGTDNDDEITKSMVDMFGNDAEFRMLVNLAGVENYDDFTPMMKHAMDVQNVVADKRSYEHPLDQMCYEVALHIQYALQSTDKEVNGAAVGSVNDVAFATLVAQRNTSGEKR